MENMIMEKIGDFGVKYKHTAFYDKVQTIELNKKKKKLFDFWYGFYKNVIDDDISSFIHYITELRSNNLPLEINLMCYNKLVHSYIKGVDIQEQNQNEYIKYTKYKGNGILLLKNNHIYTNPTYTEINDIEEVEYTDLFYTEDKTNTTYYYNVSIQPVGYLTFTEKIHRNYYTLDIFTDKYNLTEYDFVIYRLHFHTKNKAEQINEIDNFMSESFIKFVSEKYKQKNKKKKTKTQQKKDKKNNLLKRLNQPQNEEPIQEEEPIEEEPIQEEEEDQSESESESERSERTHSFSSDEPTLYYNTYENKPYQYQVSFKPYITEQQHILDMINRAYDNKPKFREFLHNTEVIYITKGIHNNMNGMLEKYDHFNIVLHYSTYNSRKYHIYIDHNEIIYYTKIERGNF